MIRPARKSDLHQIRYLAHTEFAPYAMRMRGLAPVELDLAEMVQQRRVHVFLRHNVIRAFICFAIDGPDVHVIALGLGHKMRRRGIGRMLLDVADRRGLAAGCRRVILHRAAQAFENQSYLRAKGLIETDHLTDPGRDWLILERYLR